MTIRRLVSTAIGLVLTTTALAAGWSPSATAAATGGAKGVISSQGKVLPQLTVELMQSGDDGDSYDPIASTTTNAEGAYSFARMPTSDAWSYKVRVSDRHGTIVTTVRAFRPVAGKSVTRNATVQPAGFLKGNVLRADGASPTMTRIHLIGPDVQIGNPDDDDLAYDDDRGVHGDGSYNFTGLPAGDYTVRYTDTAGSYLDQCYDNVLAALSAEPTCDSEQAAAAKIVTIVANKTSTLDAQTLQHSGAAVAGVVTNTSGAPLKNILVIPHPFGTNDLRWYDYEKSTSSAGAFTRGPLPAGRWQLSTMDLRSSVGRRDEPGHGQGLRPCRRGDGRQHRDQAQVACDDQVDRLHWQGLSDVGDHGEPAGHRRQGVRRSGHRSGRDD
jgi:hypothetical protein